MGGISSLKSRSEIIDQKFGKQKLMIPRASFIHCYIVNAFSTRMHTHWLNHGNVEEFKSSATQLVNISQIVDQPMSIAVELSCLRVGKFGGKIGGQTYLRFVFAIFIQKQK